MEIKINGETKQIGEGLTVTQLLDQLGIDRSHLAVEYNGEFLEEDQFAKQLVMAGDKLEIVRFVGGG